MSTAEKKEHLVYTFGLKEDHIFVSHDLSFLSDLMTVTQGNGVDVVLNSLTGDALHETWRACKDFGRFVDIGLRDSLDGGQLDMDIFRRSITFTAFDLTSLYYSKEERNRAVWTE